MISVSSYLIFRLSEARWALLFSTVFGLQIASLPAGTLAQDNQGEGPAASMQPSDPELGDYPPAGEQDAPGALYRPYNDLLPRALLDPALYDLPAIGPRPFADYAPDGYEEREFQDAPGVPEFRRITPPEPVTQSERGKFVTGGFAPGSFLAPATNTSFRFRGFVRLGGMYDFSPIGSKDDFVTNTIPVPQQVGQNFNFSARYSRIALETWTPTTIHDWNIHTFIEGDFFNGPAQAVGAGGNPFRLRFAFIDFGYFRLGQQNSVFQDSSAFPSTVDFAGPRGLVNQRRPGARVTIPLGDVLYWAAGVEQPFSDITTSGLGDNVQDVPDFATHLRYESERGNHVQLSALVRMIGYRPFGGEVDRQTGYGFSASSNIHPWAILMDTDPVHEEDPSGLTRSRILLQGTFGRGIGRFIQDTAGLGMDAQVDPVTGEFETVDAIGWTASYEHWFNKHWLSNVTYSEARPSSNSGQPADTYNRAKYLATSLWFIPIERLSIGVEYTWGERENIDQQSARARRLQGLVQYNF